MPTVLSISAALLLATALGTATTDSPTSKKVDSSAVSLYRQTQQLLLDRIRSGVRAQVQLEMPDASVDDGFDEYLIDDQVRLREVRRHRESVVVGTGYCNRVDHGEFECSRIDVVELGIRPIHDDRIYRTVASEAPCGTSMCRRIDVEERDNDAGTLNFVESLGATPDPTSHYAFRLLIRADGLPYSFEEARFDSTGLIEPRAVFTFDYSTPVGPVTLPVEPPAT